MSGNNKQQKDLKRHPIQVVSRRLGLSVDVLRVWEKRYDLVTPSRTEGGHRLYSDADIERLRLVREAMAGGRRVGGLAELSDDELTALVEEDRRQTLAMTAEGPTERKQDLADSFVTECLGAVHALDSGALKAAVDRAVIALPPSDFIDRVATPLMHRIGDLWYEGRLTPGHEHMASSVLRNRLNEVTEALQPENSGLRMVVSTPTGQRHEIGAVLVAATAELEGWTVTYLGPDLPAADIAHAAEQTGANIVALSITVAPTDVPLQDELRWLRRSLPKEVDLLVGGQAADELGSELKAIGARYMADLTQVRQTLREIRYAAEAVDPD